MMRLVGEEPWNLVEPSLLPGASESSIAGEFSPSFLNEKTDQRPAESGWSVP